MSEVDIDHNHGITLNVHVKNQIFPFPIGNGNQTFKWLGFAATQHYNKLVKSTV